jgi:hypothetical protein
MIKLDKEKHRFFIKKTKQKPKKLIIFLFSPDLLNDLLIN